MYNPLLQDQNVRYCQSHCYNVSGVGSVSHPYKLFLLKLILISSHLRFGFLDGLFMFSKLMLLSNVSDPSETFYTFKSSHFPYYDQEVGPIVLKSSVVPLYFDVWNFVSERPCYACQCIEKRRLISRSVSDKGIFALSRP
jgi:hypothetical protein